MRFVTTLAALVAMAFAACVGVPKQLPDPVLRLHGHNDYLQPVPCTRALEIGLGSIEADVFPVDGELLVGHERWQLRRWRTLRSMYLEPLADAVRERGMLRADGEPLVLLVDVKDGPVEAWRLLQAQLAEYAGMLTRFVDGRVEPGEVTVLLSGKRPVSAVAASASRLCALDGRLRDLDREPPPPVDLVPWISSPWRAVSDWAGSDELMPGELARLRALIAKAHAQGRELRFWGAPDRKEAWRAFLDLGIDHIDTDQPANAARFLRGSD